MAQLELRALEKMVAALCAHTDQLIQEARAQGLPVTRELRMQLQVYMERRTRAETLLASRHGEDVQLRIGRLERLVDALESSRAFFRGTGVGGRGA